MNIVDFITLRGYQAEFEIINRILDLEEKFERFNEIYEFRYVQLYNSIINELNDTTGLGGEIEFIPIDRRLEDVTEFINDQINKLQNILTAIRQQFPNVDQITGEMSS